VRNPRLLGGSKILVIEDEPDIARAVVALLERASYQVILSADGHAGLRMLHSARPDLVILDVGLPGMDGWNVLERIRDLTTVPIIMVTARTQEGDKVRGLQAGADDYMTKPFSNRELVARVDAQLRRATTPTDGGVERYYSDSRLSVDFLAHEVTADNAPVELTPTEFRLLAYLMRHPGRVLTRAQLLENVWGWDYAGESQIVETYVSYLRRKLDPLGPPMIHTQRGVGYSLRLAERGQAGPG